MLSMFLFVRVLNAPADSPVGRDMIPTVGQAATEISSTLNRTLAQQRRARLFCLWNPPTEGKTKILERKRRRTLVDLLPLLLNTGEKLSLGCKWRHVD